MESIHPHTARLPTEWGCSLIGEIRDYPWVQEAEVLSPALLLTFPGNSSALCASAILLYSWALPLLPLLQEVLRNPGRGNLNEAFCPQEVLEAYL